jgi:hypothetical protein
MQITWKHKDTDFSWPLSFENKVEIFYERALGWQLHIADLVANGGTAYGEAGSHEGNVVSSIRHSGFAVLQVCLSYFETIGQYEQKNAGTNTSTGYFKEGVRSVLPKLHKSHGNAIAKLLARLYEGARNGLYHNSMTAPGVGLGQPSNGEAMVYVPESDIFVISPERLPKILKQHLERFRAKLLDSRNASLRQNFERRFDEHNGITKPANKGMQPTAQKTRRS